MKLKELLGLPLSAALETAERGHLQLKCLYTEAPARKNAGEEKAFLEDRVIGFRDHTLIVGRFHTAQPLETDGTRVPHVGQLRGKD